MAPISMGVKITNCTKHKEFINMNGLHNFYIHGYNTCNRFSNNLSNQHLEIFFLNLQDRGGSHSTARESVS